MRLQLIMSLAADVLHKSSLLHPGCFHGDGASNCGAPARSLPRGPRQGGRGGRVPTSAAPSGWAPSPGKKLGSGEGDTQRWGARIYLFPPPSDGRVLGERRSSSEIWFPKMLNKWAGVSPKWERAAIGCCRPAVPMGAWLAVGYPQHKQSYTLAPAARGRRAGKGVQRRGSASSPMATPRTDLVRELRRRPSATRTPCAFRKKQH